MNKLIANEIEYQHRRFYRRLKERGTLVVEFWPGAKAFLESIPGITWSMQANKILIKEVDSKQPSGYSGNKKEKKVKSFKDIVQEKERHIESDLKTQFRNHQNLTNELHERYYNVSDNINGLVEALNSFNGETGLLGADLKAAKAMLKSFNKMTVGKFL
jgi:hypothetical protein